jgi:DNA-binding NtrC family response regulator
MQALVVDDDPTIRELVTTVLAGEGFEVVDAPDGESAIEIARRTSIDLVLCDVRMGPLSGFDVLRMLKQENTFDADIVLMTGDASVESALEAVCAGARDYIAKPFSIDDLSALARSTAERRRLRSTTPAAEPAVDYAELLGRSGAMIELFKTVGRVAATDLPVLICGEPGTGKEVVARTIHARSDRVGLPFAAVNCGSPTEALLDSELFGYAWGSGAGAESDRCGLFEEVNGGTLLLDEVTETSPAMQAKLLRVLQDGEVRRIGSKVPIKVNVRVLATTSRDPDTAVAAGLFRGDLLCRLNTVAINVPRLRERTGDIDLMVLSLLQRFRRSDAPPIRITPEALEKLRAYSWPGNVRELRHTTQRLAVLNTGYVVGVEDLPEKIRNAEAGRAEPSAGRLFDGPAPSAPRGDEADGRTVEYDRAQAAAAHANFVRECPRCGNCFETSIQFCDADGLELKRSLPVERTIEGRYRLDRLIGKGGMGAVYEGTDLRLARKVAIKVLTGTTLGQGATLGRFEREAQASAGLNHPNVVTVHDYGTLGDEGAFLVMELLRGRTLLSEMRRLGCLQPEAAADLFNQIIEGVKSAHRAGVIHRDLKPDNVLLVSDEEHANLVKVLDFGLARIVHLETHEASRLTVPGTVMGTFGYMSPEQLCGGEVDERGDIFSLGVMVVEALTGHRPFAGRTWAELLAVITRGDFRLDGDVPEVRDLEGILQRCLALDPEDRFPSVALLQSELIPALRRCPSLAPSESASFALRPTPAVGRPR